MGPRTCPGAPPASTLPLGSSLASASSGPPEEDGEKDKAGLGDWAGVSLEPTSGHLPAFRMGGSGLILPAQGPGGQAQARGGAGFASPQASHSAPT